MIVISDTDNSCIENASHCGSTIVEAFGHSRWTLMSFLFQIKKPSPCIAFTTTILHKHIFSIQTNLLAFVV